MVTAVMTTMMVTREEQPSLAVCCLSRYFCKRCEMAPVTDAPWKGEEGRVGRGGKKGREKEGEKVTFTHAHINTYIYIYIFIYIYMYICIYICVCVCVCIYTHAHIKK
jgi:hypothetical protein